MRKWFITAVAVVLVAAVVAVAWRYAGGSSSEPAAEGGDLPVQAREAVDLRCEDPSAAGEIVLPFPGSTPGGGGAAPVAGETSTAGAGDVQGGRSGALAPPSEWKPLETPPSSAAAAVLEQPALALGSGATSGSPVDAASPVAGSPLGRALDQGQGTLDYQIVNNRPGACAGLDMDVMAGDRVELSGERSYDADGDPLTYLWRIVSSPRDSFVALSTKDEARPFLRTDAPGYYQLSLTVNDGFEDSLSDTVLVFAMPWFVDVTLTAGVPGGFEDGAGGSGVGAAWGDYDGDGALDLYVTRNGPNILYRNNGDGRFTDVSAAAGVDSPLNSRGAAWGDFDNDGHLDLYVVNRPDASEGDQAAALVVNALYRNNGDGSFTDVAAEVGVGHGGRGTSPIWTDFDADGWLDLFVSDLSGETGSQVPGVPDVLFRNNADGTFLELGAEAFVSGGAPRPGTAPSGPSAGAVWFDYDNDGDADLFVAREMGISPLFRNDGGVFVDVSDEAGLSVSGTARGAVSGDYDNDGDLDLYVTADGPNRLWENNGDGTFADVGPSAGVAGSSPSWGAVFIDFDNDGDLDIYVANGGLGPEEQTGRSNSLFRNDGAGTFTDVTDMAYVGHEGPGRAIALADYDGDGDVDVYVVNADGQNVLYRNDIGSRWNWFGVRLLGTASNLTGIGARVEVTTSDGVTRTASPSGGSGYLGQNDTKLLFGLGASDRADVKVTWPSGIVQEFWDVWGNDLGTIREATMEGSCPMVFAWDGSTYAFVSDVLGSAVTGFYLAPDVYRFPIDTDEYLKIEDIQPKDGVYSIQIVELLNEIVYLDAAKLLVVDHPSDVEVFPNERLMLFPPFPEFRVYGASELRPPVAAFDHNGNDILPLLSQKDGMYAEGFGYLPYEGFAEEHSIVLDLGDLSGLGNILLLLNGWTHYVTSFGLYSATLNGVPPMLPRLEVQGVDGMWVEVDANMGFPAGQPKTMAYELTGKFPADDFRIRITTNLQVFWDQVLVGTYAEDATPRTTELEASTADLHWRGYPRLLPSLGDRRMYPAAYDYQDVAAERDRWTVPAGNYTRFGDVGPLLTGVDDRYVVMRHGDELTLEFDAAALPGLPRGWSRSVILYVDGYLKYVDPFVAYPSSVEPLPFHSMSSYPYPSDETYAQDESRLRYLRDYNTREVVEPATTE